MAENLNNLNPGFIPLDLIRDPHIEPWAKVLYALIYAHMDKDGWCRLKTKIMADILGCSRPQILDLLRQLKKVGWVFCRYPKSSSREIAATLDGKWKIEKR